MHKAKVQINLHSLKVDDRKLFILNISEASMSFVEE